MEVPFVRRIGRRPAAAENACSRSRRVFDNPLAAALGAGGHLVEIDHHPVAVGVVAAARNAARARTRRRAPERASPRPDRSCAPGRCSLRTQRRLIAHRSPSSRTCGIGTERESPCSRRTALARSIVKRICPSPHDPPFARVDVRPLRRLLAGAHHDVVAVQRLIVQRRSPPSRSRLCVWPRTSASLVCGLWTPV